LSKPIASFVHDLLFNGRGFTWYDPEVAPVSNTEITKALDLNLKYFDNQLLINSPEPLNLHLQIVDVNGRLMQIKEADILRGENTVFLEDIKSNGMFFILLTDKSTGRFMTKKIIKIE